MTARQVVVLGHSYDGGSRAIVEELVARTAAVVLLPPEQLATVRWSHHIDRSGRARTRMVLTNGRSMFDDGVGCVVNRMDYLPAPRLVGGTERDREYSAVELQAVVASWLAGLGERVVNLPSARGVDAGPASPRGWLALAAAGGLPVARSAITTSARLLRREVAVPADVRPLGPFVPACSDSVGRVPVEVGWSGTGLAEVPGADGAGSGADEVLVVGGRALGPLAAMVGDACVQITARAGCRVAAFRFRIDAGHPRLTEVTTRPSLARAGQAAAVAELCLAIAHRTDGAA